MRNVLATAAMLAAISSPSFAEDAQCPKAVTPEVATALGAPVGWLGGGRTVHTPAGIIVMGMPVSYVIEEHAGGVDTGAVTELHYRLQGQSKPFGQRYAPEVRKAFGCESSSCALEWKGTTAGQLTTAELSGGDLSLPKEAHGDGLKLIKADMNLANADPVFLNCGYLAPK